MLLKRHSLSSDQVFNYGLNYKNSLIKFHRNGELKVCRLGAVHQTMPLNSMTQLSLKYVLCL